MQGYEFTTIAGLFSIFAVVCYLLCYFLTTERVSPERTHEAVENNSLAKLLKNAAKNRALLSIIVASVVMLLAQLTLQSMANYIFPNYYNNAGAQSASTLTMMASMIFAATVTKPLSNKFGKAEISVASTILATAVCIALFIIRPQNVWVYVGLSFISWLGLGIFSMVSWALITDVIDDSQIKNGVREDGTIYALYSFARKLGQAAAAGLTGLLLTSIGYEKIAGEALAESVKNGIFNISSIVPAIGFALLAIILWFWYPLHRSQVDENVKYLRNMRKT
jgi:GPH family glycoside/pentoside/hexuronide:cation symporter